MQKRLNREHYGDQPPYQPASYQRFFTAGVKGSICFRVKAPERPTQGAASPGHGHLSRSDEGQFVMDQIFGTLARLETTQSHVGIAPDAALTKTQVSPWLERTRWLHYLKGVPLDRAAGLARLPTQHEEPVFYEISLAIDRLVEAAHASLCEEKVNFFGQKRITSFLPDREVFSRPLVYKLQEATYKQYKQTWKRALAFICRTSDPRQQIEFQHTLNTRQTALLDQMLALAAEKAARALSASEPLDYVCLDFCLSLLEQPLRGNIFESPLVGFLAVMGIDENNNTLHEAPKYTPKLSALIKIAQLLVLQKSVVLAEEGLVQDPLDPLDEMRKRFMTLDNATPFTWALHLRSFGKRIRDCTTSLGYMRWSEDGQTVKYRDIELQIPVFKRFVLQQVQSAQQSLETLFMLGADESRAEIVPRIALHQIRDDPTNVAPGWSFLKDRRNADTIPPGDMWLLQRVVGSEKLRDRFCTLDGARHIIWDLKEFQLYRAQVDQFLETLLLLVHLTAGQPARGTEITGLQYANTMFHRNVFVEDGLVAIVTSYHKGYTCTGTTKIIHRYLPREISELVVYYLWLILPFVQKMTLLIAEQQDPEIPSSNMRKFDTLTEGHSTPTTKKSAMSFLLWPAGKGAWSSSRLTKILKRETSKICQSPLTLATYRHVAIAISRRHLAQGGFKRDYDIEESAADGQTAHTSWTAGRLYARGLEEAPGHVEARRAGFRMVSRSWHKFLGFSDPTLTKKRVLQDVTNPTGSKRARTEEGRREGIEGNLNMDHLWEY